MCLGAGTHPPPSKGPDYPHKQQPALFLSPAWTASPLWSHLFAFTHPWGWFNSGAHARLILIFPACVAPLLMTLYEERLHSQSHLALIMACKREYWTRADWGGLERSHVDTTRGSEPTIPRTCTENPRSLAMSKDQLGDDSPSTHQAIRCVANELSPGRAKISILSMGYF